MPEFPNLGSRGSAWRSTAPDSLGFLGGRGVERPPPEGANTIRNPNQKSNEESPNQHHAGPRAGWLGGRAGSLNPFMVLQVRGREQALGSVSWRFRFPAVTTFVFDPSGQRQIKARPPVPPVGSGIEPPEGVQRDCLVARNRGHRSTSRKRGRWFRSRGELDHAPDDSVQPADHPADERSLPVRGAPVPERGGGRPKIDVGGRAPRPTSSRPTRGTRRPRSSTGVS